jgi:hypothetical protein
LATPGIDLPADSGPLGAGDRLICLDMESTVGSVCQLEASAGSNSSRCLFPELDQSERLCISPLQHDRQMSEKDHEGRDRIDSMYVCMYVCIAFVSRTFTKKDQMTAECATIYIIYKKKGTPKRIDES